MKIKIRPETENDYLGMKEVNDLAFEQTNEDIMVEKLRLLPIFVNELSIVAECEDIFFATIKLFLNIRIARSEYRTFCSIDKNILSFNEQFI